VHIIAVEGEELKGESEEETNELSTILLEFLFKVFF
jgi:hypothetical protein